MSEPLFVGGRQPLLAISSVTDVRVARFATAKSKVGLVNGDIQADSVSVVDDTGVVRHGVPLRDAIHEARRQGVDLVQVSPAGKTGVICRMFDTKKRLFEMKKATKKVSKQQKPKSDKEVIIGVKIALTDSVLLDDQPNDLRVKVEQLKRFLGKGHKVKVTVKFAQAFHLKGSSLEQLERINELIDDETGVADSQPKDQFGGVYVYYAPAAN
ncbi:hypothetical protein BBJ28_00004971 [Nothophytophthora sp. Chile5]|nr:hypothetical protein BBJ28_00004971 [Nothophytophthora sp. Chile5]